MAAFSSDSLTILAVSDVRTSLGKVNRLGEWLVKNGRTPDAVVVCGDLGALSPADRLVPELAVGSEGDLSAVLCGLESIVCRVLYVPGVSDPPSVHAAPGAARVRLTTHSTNLHGACFALASDLACTGLSCLVDVEVAAEEASAANVGIVVGVGTSAEEGQSVNNNTANVRDHTHQEFPVCVVSPVRPLPAVGCEPSQMILVTNVGPDGVSTVRPPLQNGGASDGNHGGGVRGGDSGAERSGDCCAPTDGSVATEVAAADAEAALAGGKRDIMSDAERQLPDIGSLTLGDDGETKEKMKEELEEGARRDGGGADGVSELASSGGSGGSVGSVEEKGPASASACVFASSSASVSASASSVMAAQQAVGLILREKECQDHTVLHLHGGAAGDTCQGEDLLGGVHVVNPGSLKYVQFIVVAAKRGSMVVNGVNGGGRWWSMCASVRVGKFMCWLCAC